MSRPTASHGPEHFRRLYADNDDPWQYRTSAYEQAKYRRTIASLGGRRFRTGFEAGCSIGVLTRKLADCCAKLLAVDLLPEPLHAAQRLCTDQPWVQFSQMRIPGEWPADRFDLIVLSEVLYFLVPADIEAVADRVRDTLEPGGIVLLVNWRGEANDPTTGDAAAAVFLQRTRGWLDTELQHLEAAYRLDLLLRR